MDFLIDLGFIIILVSIIWFIIEVIKKIMKKPSKISYSIMLFISGWILALGSATASIWGLLFFLIFGGLLIFGVYKLSNIKTKKSKSNSSVSNATVHPNINKPITKVNVDEKDQKLVSNSATDVHTAVGKLTTKVDVELHNSDSAEISKENDDDDIIPKSVLNARIVNYAKSNSLRIPKYKQFLLEHNVELKDASENKHKDYVVFDLETTGLNYQTDEIIQVSALKVKNDEVVDQFNHYVKPANSIPFYITDITGITNEIVANADTIDQVMLEFSDFVDNYILIGHNIAKFDIPFIVNNGFFREQIKIVDTLRMVRRMKEDFPVKLENMKLQTLKDYFGLNYTSHDGLGDCKTNLVVYKKLRDHDLDYKVPICQEANSELKNLTFVLTGRFIKPKKEIKTEIESHGGRVTGSVSKKTDYLIDGEQVAKKLTDGKHSASELRAHELQKAKGKIKIIAYPQLKQLINSRKPNK